MVTPTDLVESTVLQSSGAGLDPTTLVLIVIAAIAGIYVFWQMTKSD